MTIGDLMKQAHDFAKSKGWWDADIQRTFGDFCALLHSEVSEAYEDYRHNRALSETFHAPDGKPCGIPSELADLMIRIADNAAAFGIDLEAAIKEKMVYNATRPYRHGGKRT